MNLADLTPHLLYDFSSEADLIRAIEEVSRKFTVEREKISDYLRDPRLVSAYCAFYLTTNYPKFEGVLPWMPQAWIEALSECDLIDLGAGPGTFSLAWRKWRGEAGGHVYQVEASELMRAQARKVWDGFYPSNELIQSAGRLPESERPRLLLFGHSANEMGHEGAIRYIKEFNPQHILFIEPGTSAFFPEMLKIRDYLLGSHYQVVFPCPGSTQCPMEGSGDWCHQYIQVRHSPDVERLTQLVEKDRRRLPLIVHVYSRVEYQRAEERLIRVFPETKFSFEWQVCHNDVLEHYQVMKRGFSKQQEKQLARWEAGQALETELDKEFDQIKRVKLLNKPS